MGLANGDQAVDNAGVQTYPHFPHSFGTHVVGKQKNRKGLKLLIKIGYPQYAQALLLQSFSFLSLTN
ncbi:hypothetical protein [Wenzhouxiangella limi]|uniref:Uncharacterized protein n=1 Tax=Wenzhouxiangella limi TaxID=2707351 RepID=A0A845UZ35_9GAMM|nr:hypothetical protein [Wenzhouxiangella limi]NDY95160.1 hypothetical protein [Wenzhouxiangella limi]